MNKLFTTLIAAIFAAATMSVAVAQDQKKEQAHKGTPEQGTVQKKDQKQDKKKDGTGGEMKKGEGKKADDKGKGDEKKAEAKTKADDKKAEGKKDGGKK